MMVKDSLVEDVYAAELAGLGYSMASTKGGLLLKVAGD
jgi:hypothetical protein